MRFIPLIAAIVLTAVAAALCYFSLYWLFAVIPLAAMSIGALAVTA